MTAFVGPWGATYASNLTPDRDTGIGTWREADFIKDLRAIYAYLMAQPAVKNKVPEYAPPLAPVGKAGEGLEGQC